MEFKIVNDVRTEDEKTKDFTRTMRYIMDLEKRRKELSSKGENNMSMKEMQEYADLGINISLQRQQLRQENLENMDLRK